MNVPNNDELRTWLEPGFPELANQDSFPIKDEKRFFALLAEVEHQHSRQSFAHRHNRAIYRYLTLDTKHVKPPELHEVLKDHHEAQMRFLVTFAICAGLILVLVLLLK